MRHFTSINPECIAEAETLRHPFRVIPGPGSEGQLDAWEIQDGDFKYVAFAPTRGLAVAVAEAMRAATTYRATEILTQNALERDCR